MKKKSPINIKFMSDIVRPRRRLLSFLADIFSFVIISCALYSIVVFPLVKLLPSYKSAITNQETALNVCKNMYIASHLLSYNDDDEAMTGTEMVNKFIESKISGTDLESGQYTDIFLYFYVTYANNNLLKDGEYLTYTVANVNENIYHIDNQEEPYLWTLQNDDINQPVHFLVDAITNYNAYLDGEINATSKSYYDKIIAFSQEQLVAAEMTLATSDQYVASYAEMNRSNTILYYHISSSATILYTILFFLYFLLVPALLKNGQTLGKKILKISLVDEKKFPIRFKNLLLKSILEFITYSFVTVFIPYLVLGTSTFLLPLISIGSFTISLSVFCLITFLIAIASFVFMNINQQNQSLPDWAVGCYAVDGRRIVTSDDQDDRVINSPFLEEDKKSGS